MKFSSFTLNRIAKITFFIFTITFLILLFYYHFQIPNYYVNKELAFEAINNGVGIIEVNRLYRNKEYFFQNGLFHVCTFTFVALVIMYLFNNKYVKNLINIKPYISTALSYIFLNLSYVVWAHFTMNIFEIELKKFVYPANADSIMIPILGTYMLLSFLAFLYYPIVNIFNFIVFNTKISNKFLIIMYKVLFCIFVVDILINLDAQYSSNIIIIYIIKIGYLILLQQSIDKLKSKYDISLSSER